MAVELESLVLSISADTAQLKRALLRTQKDAKDTADNVNQSFQRLDPFGRMQANFSRSSGAMAADAQNLRFQLNDLFTQVQSGTSIVQAFGQQAGQISQVLGSAGGIRGSAALVGTALMGMLNPLYAIPLALSIALPAMMNFFSSSEEGAEDVTKALERQLAVINELRKSKGLEPLNRTGQDEIDRFIALRAAMKENDAIAAQLAESLNEISGEILSMPVEEFEGQTHTVQQLDSALSKLAQGIANGNPDFLDFAKTMEDIEKRKNLPEDIQKLVTKVADLAAQGALGARNLKDLRDSIQQVADSFSSMQIAFPQLDPLGSAGGGFFVLTPEMQTNLDQYRTWVGEAGSLTAKFIKDREQFRSKAYSDTRESTGKHDAFRVGFGSDTYVDEMGKIQKVTKDTVITIEQANADLGRRIGEFQSTIQRQIGPEFWKSLDESQQAALTSIAYNYGNLPASIVKAIKEGDRGQVAQAIASLPATVNAKRRQMEAELYGGGSFTAQSASKTVPALDAESQALDKAAASAAKLLQQQRALTPEQEALAKSANQIAQQYSQIAQTAVGGFVNDLRNGVEAGEAFNNMLNRVIDGIINMAIEALFAKNALGGLFGGLFGGGGGASVATMHTGSKTGGVRNMRNVSPAMFANAPRLHNGLLPGEFPAILQKGEIVIPKSAARAAATSGDNSRVDIGNIEINVPSGVAANSDQGKALGMQIDKAVQAIIVRERRPGGLLRG